MHGTKIITVTPTLDTNAYAAGDHLGSLMTLTEALGINRHGKLRSLTILDKAKQKSDLVVHLFQSSPTLTSLDNAALDISDAQMATHYIGSVSISASAYIDLANCSVVTYGNLELILESLVTDRGTLYAILESQGAPTYAASDLVLKFGIERG